MATLRKVRAVEKHRRRRARRVRVGRPDGQLTSAAGLEAVRELDRGLGVTGALEAGARRGGGSRGGAGGGQGGGQGARAGVGRRRSWPAPGPASSAPVTPRTR